MSYIKDLAKNYLTESNEAKKFGILLKVEKYLNTLEFKSRGKLLKELGLSYFAGINSSQKIEKGQKMNFDTLVLYLSASKNAGVDLCNFASTGCRLACLVESGHALIEKLSGKHTIAVSRMVKSWLVIYRKDLAVKVLEHEIKLANNRANRKNKSFACRLNGTSDLDFTEVYNNFPKVTFYDYTKDPNRKSLPNYHVTFSYSQSNKARISHYKAAQSKGQAIAFPVLAKDFEEACSLPNCYSMDSTDLRFTDKAGKYGILKAKKTKNLDSGINEKFILSKNELIEVIEKIES